MDDSYGVRRFGRVNWLGMWTLAHREVNRFWSVKGQTVMAPLVTGALFLFIFNIAIGPRRGDVMGVPLIVFLAPGIMMMSAIQNAFANTSSSMMIAKMQGTIVDTLMPPLSAAEIVSGYILGGVARAMAVVVGLALGVGLFLGVWPDHIGLMLLYTVMGGVLMSAIGLFAGMYAEKFDQMAVITNFVITPLSFLSGTFYSITFLPPVLERLSHFNPFFYLIDGMRYAMIGQSDASILTGIIVLSALCVIAVGSVWRMIKIGYRIKP